MAQLTLSEKATLANNPVFQQRIWQGLFSKANFWNLSGSPTNLLQQKAKTYTPTFLKGNGGVDLGAIVRFWLANYNTDPADLILAPDDLVGQPTDDAILNTAALDAVYNTLAGIQVGDDLIPI